MRVNEKKGGVSVHAISGTHCVLLAMDASSRAREGLKGFAIGVRKGRERRTRWLRGFKFFEEVVHDPQPGTRRSTLEHPIQSFLWGDYAATPGTRYDYVVRPMYGKPGQLRSGEDVEIRIATEPVEQGKHGIYFNRGAIPSQAFADKFGNRGPDNPDDPNADDVRWLSRGLLQAALDFIDQAKGSRFELRVAAYEFNYAPILNALRAAAGSGAKVRIVYEAGQKKENGILQDTTTTKANERSIRLEGLLRKRNLQLIKRTNRRDIPHNKFMILLENNRPLQVWTGSTNFTASGFLGQTNVGHVVRDSGIAQAFSLYWEQLATDPMQDPFQGWCSANFPHPGNGMPDDEITCMFSPRTRSRMLNWYGDRLDEAHQTIMMTAAFGVTRKLAERFNNDRDYLRFLLMERKNSSEETQAMLERDRDTQIALGSKLNSNALKLGLDGHSLDEWYKREEHFRKKGHVFYLHTKIMMIDVLTERPLVFTGSANFSPNSLLSNDENMLLIGGNTHVADVYLTEFQRLFNHFYFRKVAAELAASANHNPATAAFLDPTDHWVDRHFKPGTLHCRRRELFRAG